MERATAKSSPDSHAHAAPLSADPNTIPGQRPSPAAARLQSPTVGGAEILEYSGRCTRGRVLSESVAASRCAQPLLVAIVGGSGAGKSWLAKKLQTALEPHAARLSLDDFYLDRSHVHSARRAKMNFDHPRAIDWPYVEKALGELLAGRSVHLPRYNFKTHCRLPEQNVLAARPVVLVDGLWLLRRPSLRRVFGLKIFIDCPSRTRRQRRLARDLRSRGRSRTAILEQLRKTVQPMHARYVTPQQRWADVVIRHDFGEKEIQRLARELRERLNLPRSTQTINGEGA